MNEILNHEALTGIFGYWPSFHDAEVLSIHLERVGQKGYYGPTLITKIHVFEITNEISERGSYVLHHQTVVTMRFFQVDRFQAEGLNHQNVLWGLEIDDVSDRQLVDVKFEVRFPSSFGLQMTFVCKAIEVVSVEPYDAFANK